METTLTASTALAQPPSHSFRWSTSTPCSRISTVSWHPRWSRRILERNCSRCGCPRSWAGQSSVRCTRSRCSPSPRTATRPPDGCRWRHRSPSVRRVRTSVRPRSRNCSDRDSCPVIAGQGTAPGMARSVEGGYLLTGKWSFASGLKHGDHIHTLGIIEETGEPRIFVVPVDKAELVPRQLGRHGPARNGQHRLHHRPTPSSPRTTATSRSRANRCTAGRSIASASSASPSCATRAGPWASVVACSTSSASWSAASRDVPAR